MGFQIKPMLVEHCFLQFCRSPAGTRPLIPLQDLRGVKRHQETSKCSSGCLFQVNVSSAEFWCPKIPRSRRKIVRNPRRFFFYSRKPSFFLLSFLRGFCVLAAPPFPLPPYGAHTFFPPITPIGWYFALLRSVATSQTPFQSQPLLPTQATMQNPHSFFDLGHR